MACQRTNYVILESFILGNRHQCLVLHKPTALRYGLRVTDPLDDSDMEYVPEISCFVATRKFLLLGSIVMGQEF